MSVRHVSSNETITVAGAPPAVGLTFTGLDNNPVSCVQANLSFAPGSVALATAEYSLDGGTTWAGVPVTTVPAVIDVPGSGTIYFVAAVFDIAGQIASTSSSFMIASPCAAPDGVAATCAPSSCSVSALSRVRL